MREDNADLRLTETGRRLGVVSDLRWAAFEAKREAIAREQDRLKSVWLSPKTHAHLAPTVDIVQVLGKTIERDYSLHELLRRPGVSYAGLMTLPERASRLPIQWLQNKLKSRRSTMVILNGRRRK